MANSAGFGRKLGVNDSGLTIDQHIGVLSQFAFTAQVRGVGGCTIRGAGVGNGTSP